MNRYLRLLGSTILPLVLVSWTIVQTPAGWATITGRVLDSDGRPVPGAKISVFPMDVAVTGGMPRQPITDEEGRYRLVSPAFPGKTRLCAVKESAGYPDTQGLLFTSGGDSMPEVSLVPGGHLENVDIRLGPPDGILEGSVIDAETRAPVPKARITLHRRDPESMHSTSLPKDGHFLFALPPAPIEIAVVAPGYTPWKYKDAQSGVENLVLTNSDHRVITVELKRK
jgi:hypothetical protein